MRLQALLLAIAMPSAGLANELTTVDATKQVCGQAATKFASASPETAYEVLLPYWPLAREEVQNLGYQTKTQLDMVGGRFGAAIGAEHVKTTLSGESLVKHVPDQTRKARNALFLRVL